MKQNFLILVVLLSISITTAADEIKTRISSVAVYSDRAQVVRTGTIKLSKGEQTVILKNLPARIEPSSIQVSGTGNAVVKDVAFKREHFVEEQDVKVKALLDEKALLEEQIMALRGKTSAAESEKRFVEDIAKKLTSVSDKSAPIETSPEKWIKLVEFYRSRLDSLDKEVRGVSKSIVQIQSKIEKIDREIGEFGRERGRIKNMVEVVLLVNSDSPITLSIAYVVLGPSWRPVYDTRILTDSKKMVLSYMALVRQNTSEDWEKAEIKLSTAQPQIDGNVPELQPWRIDFYRPMAQLRATGSSRRGDMAKKVYVSDDMMVKSFAPSMAQAEMMAAPEIEYTDAAVEANATSVSFVVPGENSIKSDNLEHKVNVVTLEFAADFKYTTVPKLVQSAFLRAKVKNSSDFPLLSGENSIFLDNNYVARSSIPAVAPSEEFWTSVGTDPGIKIEYKFVNKYETQSGVFSKRTKYIYEYIIKVSNKKKSDEEITVSDQFPLSANQEIKVELIEPKIIANDPKIKLTDTGIIEWNTKMKGSSEIEIPLKFSVEYPKGESISGL